MTRAKRSCNSGAIRSRVLPCYIDRMRTKVIQGLDYFTGWAGLDLYFHGHKPKEPSLGTVVIVHGYAEHSGRFAHVIDFLNQRGFTVYAYDQRGHGRSEGIRGDVVKFDDFVKDLHTFVGIVREREPSGPLFLLGVSTGAAVALLFAARYGELLDGLMSCEVYLKDKEGYDRLKVAAAKALVRIAPLMPAQELDSSRISSDPEVVRSYDTDPLVYRGNVRVRMGYHFLRMLDTVKPALPQVKAPILILHGELDRLADPESSRIVFENIASSDKRLEILPGFHHEIMNEPEKEKPLGLIGEWLVSHAKSGR